MSTKQKLKPALIAKNQREVIRIELKDTEWRGAPMVDVRIWAKAAKDKTDCVLGENGLQWKEIRKDDLVPTRKGTLFNANLLPQVIKALQAIHRQVQGN